MAELARQEWPQRAHVNIGSAERWLSIAGGAALAAYGFKRRGTPGRMAMLAGMTLLQRGITGHCYGYQALGIDHANGSGHAAIADRGSDTRRRLGGSRGVHVDQSVMIDRPVAEVYRFWRNFENLPRFMQHLESVAMREKGISHWVARAPAGTTVDWDARIIADHDEELIAWQSLEGSTVATAGSVSFDEVDGGTRVRVRLQYDPPGGKVGAAVARLFGEEPGIQIREDLDRFKVLMERKGADT